MAKVLGLSVDVLDGQVSDCKGTFGGLRNNIQNVGGTTRVNGRCFVFVVVITSL